MVALGCGLIIAASVAAAVVEHSEIQPPSCGIGGQGPFTLTINKISISHPVEQVKLEVDPFDKVEDLITRISPDFVAELRHHGERENQSKDLDLISVGISQPMVVDLHISSIRRLEANSPVAAKDVV